MPATPQIFVCYRHADTRAITGRIRDRLAARFGDDRIFRDIESIAHGAGFDATIEPALARAEALVIVIGPEWSTVETADGRKRLDVAGDPVRKEIEAALAAETPLVAVLAEGAAMPTAETLPAPLRPLTKARAVHIDSGDDFDVRMANLVAAIETATRPPPRRHALLIAVDARGAPKAGRSALALQRTLDTVGYRCEILGPGGKDPTFRRLERGIPRFLAAGAPTETRIVAFAGIGLRHGGIDHLAPSDADPEDLPDALVPIADLVPADCPAGATLLIIDPGDGGAALTGHPIEPGWMNTRPDRWPTAGFACLTAAPGDGPRLLDAVADALSADPVATAAELIAALPPALTDQIPRWCLDDARRLRAPLRTRAGAEPARSGPERVKASPLWTCCDDARRDRMREAAAALVDRLDRAFEPPDVEWLSPAFADRALTRIEWLIGPGGQTPTLSATEVALLTVVPFVHHAARAALIGEAAAICGPALTPPDGEDPLRSSLGRYLRASSDLPARLAAVADDPSAARALIGWTLCRWHRTEPRAWDLGATGLVPDAIRGALRADGPLGGGGHGATLLELAACLGDPDRIDRRDALHAARTIGGGRPDEQRIREKMVAWITALGGAMAIDPSSLDDVVIEHVGHHDPLAVSGTLDAIAAATWDPHGDGRALTVRCDHPALDDALRRHVEQADRDLVRLRALTVANGDRWAPLRGLPTRLTDAGVEAAEGPGGPAYQRPHLRMQLAQREVRQLLMGERLYGERGVAVRELYQNALDACRHRTARREYLRRTGRVLRPWRGRIIFEQGVDPRRGPYIECRDNGIGMGNDQLVRCFARAGKRFVETTAFLEEQAVWADLDDPVEFHPNSQFGIGVFSYFMLADEVEVNTRRVDAEDAPAERRLTVRLSSLASLFRIRPGAPTGGDGGTTVRLYLSETGARAPQVSCLDVLRRHLAVAEFETVAIDGDDRQTWAPGELSLTPIQNPPDPGERSRRRMRELRWLRDADVGVLRGSVPHVWWISVQEGRLLADGIVTAVPRPYAVIDLRHAHRPGLSLDRLRIVRHDAAHLGRSLRDALPALWETVPAWLDYEWLWAFGKVHPDLIEPLIEGLAARDIRLSVSSMPHLGQLAVRALGWFPDDAMLLQPMLAGRLDETTPMPYPLAAFRIGKLRAGSGAGSRPLSAGPTVLEYETCLKPTEDAWVDGPVTAAALFETAYRNGLSLTAVAHTLRVHADALGCTLEFDPGRCPDVRVALQDAWLSAPPDADEPWALLSTAAALGWTVEAAHRRASALAGFLGRSPPTLPADRYPNRALDGLDASLLGKMRPVGPSIRPIVVLARAATLGRTPGEIVARLLDWGPLLGLDIERADEVAGWRIDDARPSDAALLSERFDGEPPYVGRRISPAHILGVAAKTETPVAEVIARLAAYGCLLDLEIPPLDPDRLPAPYPTRAELGCFAPGPDGTLGWSPGPVIRRATRTGRSLAAVMGELGPYAEALGVPAITSWPEQPDRGDVRLLTAERDTDDHWIDGRVTPRQLLDTARRLDISPQEALARLERYAPPLDLTEARALRRWPTLTPAQIDLFSPEPGEPPPGPIRMLDVLRVALEHGEEPADILRDLSPLTPAPTVEVPADGLRDVPPAAPPPTVERPAGLDLDRFQLSGTADFVLARAPLDPDLWPDVFRARDVLRLAREASAPPLIVVDALRALSPCFELSPELARWPSPDRLDWKYLAGADGLVSSWWDQDTIDGVTLAVLSLRAGTSVRAMADRVAPYAAVLSLPVEPPPGNIPDDLVLERIDETVLSVGLDGKAPWVDRAIGRHHIQRCAWVTGLSLDEVTARFRRLACLGIVLEG